MRKFITEGAGLPKWSSPISHAVVVGNICYLSGQLSLDETGKYISGTVENEAKRSLMNLFRAVEASGFRIEDIVFIDVALIDIDDLKLVNAVFADLFSEGKRPARTVYQAAALPFGAKVKVVGIAIQE